MGIFGFGRKKKQDEKAAAPVKAAPVMTEAPAPAPAAAKKAPAKKAAKAPAKKAAKKAPAKKGSSKKK